MVAFILGSYYITTMPKSWAWALGVMVAQSDRHPAGAGSIPAESTDFGTKPHPARKGGIGVSLTFFLIYVIFSACG